MSMGWVNISRKEEEEEDEKRKLRFEHQMLTEEKGNRNGLVRT